MTQRMLGTVTKKTVTFQPKFISWTQAGLPKFNKRHQIKLIAHKKNSEFLNSSKDSM